jgi:hypothetical protein
MSGREYSQLKQPTPGMREISLDDGNHGVFETMLQETDTRCDIPEDITHSSTLQSLATHS